MVNPNHKNQSDQSHQQHHHEGGHIMIPLSVSQKTLYILLGLTGLTVLASKHVTGLDLGVMATAVALLIASVKGVFVALYFMQLKYDEKIYGIILIASVFFLLLLLGISGIDIYTRLTVDSTL